MKSVCFEGARQRVALWAACSFAAVLMAACGGGGGGGDTASEGGGNLPGTITGIVVDAGSHTALAGASVRAGDAVTTTASDGSFSLAGTGVGERVVVTASANGYAINFEGVAVEAGTASSIDMVLVPLGLSATVSAASGGTFDIPGSPARLTIPANALVRNDGTAFTGTAELQMAAIAPATNLDSMPGALLARNGGGEGPIESFGALSVRVVDSAGEALGLAGGRIATVRIPVSSRTTGSAIPTSVPLFYFDDASGLWVQEGSAALDPTGSFFEGTVSRLVAWNADQTLETITYTGCAVDGNGRRLAGARVQSEGIDYSGRSTVQTNGSGVFVVPMKRNGRATIAAETGAMVSNTVSAGPSAVSIDGSSNCLVLTASADSLTIRLTWGERPSDVDSHVYFANGSHVYYVNQGSLTSDPYAALDVDDTSSFGPEVITLRRMMVGTHRYAVHNYSGTSNPGLTASPVRVELNWNGTTRVFTPPAGETASTDWWAVFDFTVAANCSVTVTPLGTWSSGSPAPGSSGGTTYCSP